MGGGYWSAIKKDTGCGSGTNPGCENLFDRDYGSDEKSYNEWGLGVAYWMALIAGIFSIVAIIFAFLASSGGGEK